ICLKATLRTFDILQIELVENVSNINYYFTARCIYACFEADTCSSCTDKNVVIDSFTNGQGSGSSYISTNYPFVLNQVFTVLFHMRPSSVDVYIHRTLYKSFLTTRPPQVVRSIQVQGTIDVHELSF
ncbi:galectin-related protein precursor, partial [Biomphalaria glabrata]